MQKTLKALAAIGIMACVGYVVAQGQLRSPGQLSGQDSGTAIAGKVGAGRFAPANGAQKALREYIIAIDNRNVMLAREKNRGDIAQSCVDVQCYYVLATMRPDERKHEVDEVWQVDKYRPNGQWNHITSAPILVDELLRIDAKTDKQINSILSAANDKWFAQFDAWTKDLAKEFPGKTWATMTEAEKQRYHARSQELRNNWLKGRTTADISTEHAVYVTKTMDEVRKLLSKSQLAEFNGIIAKFDKHMAAAYAGSKNPLGATGVGGGK